MENDKTSTLTFTQNLTDANTSPYQYGIPPEILHRTLKDNTYSHVVFKEDPGSGQAKALMRIMTNLKIEKGFHVLSSATPFLYSIADMDRMGVKLDNIENLLIQGEKK
ncbi:hypothetical protein E4U58_006294, partial [Claviceps cyperi]